MVKIFRKIRHRSISEGKTKKYLLYAIGEIVLVVIGILIALQVNNWNIEKSYKKREAKYLTNIVLDLKKDIVRLEYLVAFRKNRLLGDQKLIQEMNGVLNRDLAEVSKNVVNTLMEQNFSPNNTTFLELTNSGNFNLITNDSIKIFLLELEELYKTNTLNIAHETFDYREYISKPAANLISIDQLFPVFIGVKTIEEQQITRDNFNALFKSRAYKNGLFIMTFMSKSYITAYETIKMKSEKIIELIELTK
ncbi:hypothetical protein P700755_002417 [Psychroflexus torquis ATCC 700755]|uniref:Uncharacterized protein n=1 Tax=Psychroflexus torquis (strain ATCC 700755 / CIP 106069 / ACAM 623) TaxID=313595 RepID=K4IFM8_PSYTT|nr:DUF6090 family protein [Psychroflexus torquis]AFU69189.1 hypothetical protein P700755_002417 [Psychroflexus torquis ATCC 700755]